MSDLIVDQLEGSFEYIALNPGGSLRGLHDSLVDGERSDAPRMLVCLHEEHAVAIAHGYAKVTGEPMAVALHANVGLMHASMAIFNAWCDRVPILIIGSNGPGDAARRRPWIDWIHSSADQGAMVRNFVKWDDEPRSAAAALESIERGRALARQLPAGPVYIALDSTLQEEAAPEGMVRREGAVVYDAAPSAEATARVVQALADARSPVLVLGRGRRTEAAWNARIALAESVGAAVIADVRSGTMFPTGHPLYLGTVGQGIDDHVRARMRQADCVVILDSIDAEGFLQKAYDEVSRPPVWMFTPDPFVHNGWSKDHQAHLRDGVTILCDPDQAVLELQRSWDEEPARRGGTVGSGRSSSAVEDGAAVEVATREPRPRSGDDRLSMDALAELVSEFCEANPISLSRVPIGWPSARIASDHPLDYLGGDGGAGIGSGPGMVVGTALALQDQERVALGVLGDGDFLMGSSALWTACRYRLGLIVVVANNQAYFNDVLHQEHIARERGRPLENRWIGQTIQDPHVDVPSLAAAYGCRSAAPAGGSAEEVVAALYEALQHARDGHATVIDVPVLAEYDPGESRVILGTGGDERG